MIAMKSGHYDSGKPCTPNAFLKWLPSFFEHSLEHAIEVRSEDGAARANLVLTF
jgi:hypothetical protein